MTESYYNERNSFMTTFSIDLKALFMEILDKIVIIVLGGIVAGLASFLLVSTVLHLNYESVTKLYIKPQETGSNSSYVSLEVGSLLTTDYSEMIVGRDIIEDTIMHFDLDTIYERFSSKVKVENPTDTRILEISVKDKDPYLARNMAIYIRDKAIVAIEEKMGSEGISVIQQANLPNRTVISRKLFSFLMGFLVMVLIAIGVVIRYLVVDTLVSADDIEKRMKLPVLGTIALEKGGR